MIQKYAVIGRNINYSLSPIIHNSNFKSLNESASYEIVNISNIHEEIVNLRQLSGFNITIPFKEEIIKYCSYLDEESNSIKAVNCVKVIDNIFYGFNTDVYGINQLFIINNVDLNNKNVLIIGSGGSAKAVFYCLKKFYNCHITVSNRTINKAYEITNNIIEYHNLSNQLEQFDIVINCTNVGVINYESPVEILKIKDNAFYIDLNYQNKSKFLVDASNLGAKTINGLDMLIYQAAKSYEIWFNRKANIEAIKEGLRRCLQGNKKDN